MTNVIPPEFILDAHLDIAYATLTYDRPWTRSVYKQRQIESGKEVEEAEGMRTAALPEALLGRVGVAFGTIFTAPYKAGALYSSPAYTYRTPREAYDQGMRQLDVYARLADENANIILIRTQSELQKVLDSWAAGVPMEKHLFGIVMLMEGGDPILEPRQFEEWYERGVRIVGPAWGATRYSGGTGEPGPLTAIGKELHEVMASFNAVLDISHASEHAALESLDNYPGAIIASHSNARKFRNTDRHLTDVAIRRLGERGGVMGVPMFNVFLKDGWLRSAGGKKEEVTLDHVIMAIDHVCQLTGSAAHVGIGSDMDGGFGLQSTPAEIDTISDLRLIAPRLAARGYAPDDVAAIMGGNFLRILRQTLPT
jgi:membrane dipeptidase